MKKLAILFLLIIFTFAGFLSAKELDSKDFKKAAEEKTIPEKKEVETMPEEGNNGAIHIYLSMDVMTQEYGRGLFVENQGFISKNSVKVEFSLYEKEDTNLTFSMELGTRIHSSNPWGSGGQVQDPRALFEVNYSVFFTVGFAKYFSFTPKYTIVSSPNKVFKTFQEISFELTFSDSKIWGGSFALCPSALIAFEVDGAADGRHEGIYLELGLEPTFTLSKESKYPITICMPIVFGFSLHDYYDYGTDDDDGFGFAEFGIKIGVPLSFIPKKYGLWKVSAHLQFIILDGNTEEHNQPAHHDVEVIGVFGLDIDY